MFSTIETTPSPEPSQEPIVVEDQDDVSEDSDDYSSESQDTITSAETVYATTTVNVRAEANTTAQSIGKLSAGQSVSRLLVMKDGWSKILYNNKDAYIKSEFLTTDKPVTTAPQKSSAPLTPTKSPTTKPTKKPSSKSTKAPSATLDPEVDSIETTTPQATQTPIVPDESPDSAVTPTVDPNDSINSDTPTQAPSEDPSAATIPTE